MRTAIVLMAAIALVLPWLASAVVADDLVRFSDGRYLKVRSHEIRNQAARLELAPESRIVIPLRQIDSITRGGRVVYDVASEPPGDDAAASSRPVPGDAVVPVVPPANREDVLLSERLRKPDRPHR